jgi:hypothetical protein
MHKLIVIALALALSGCAAIKGPNGQPIDLIGAASGVIAGIQKACGVTAQFEDIIKLIPKVGGNIASAIAAVCNGVGAGHARMASGQTFVVRARGVPVRVTP